MSPLPNAQEFLEFLSQYARRYLACGGPTSRLEESMAKLGAGFGISTEIFATPTGVFFTCKERDKQPITALARIKDSSINLGELCRLERVLEEVSSRKTNIREATEFLQKSDPHSSPYPTWHFAFAAFVAGFVVSFDSYQSLMSAWISGLITLITWIITSPILGRIISNAIFRDFLGASFALFLASLANVWNPLSIEAYSIGALVLLVPGLLLTTAIAELAEQNLVSGTAKLMKALLVLLAIGLAYVLVHEISHSLRLEGILEATKQKPRVFMISFLSVLSSVYCFGVIFKVPPVSLVWASLTGLLAWLALKGMQGSAVGIAAPFVASVVVGFSSLIFGKLFRIPSQTFSVPGLMALLPGMLAFSSFRYFALGQEETGMALSFKVLVTAISITLGLITARVPFLMWKGIWGETI